MMKPHEKHAFKSAVGGGADVCEVCGTWREHSLHVGIGGDGPSFAARTAAADRNGKTFGAGAGTGGASGFVGDTSVSVGAVGTGATFVAYAGGGPSAFVKADTGKARTDLLPPRALLAVAGVLEYGCRKYAAGNWRKVDDTGRYIAAGLRHVFAYMTGERVDAESGLPHLAHAVCCLCFILELDIERALEPRGPATNGDEK